ncbi:SGNH hydrolase-type esterase domain-containing protein [Zopfochytrium polystomum]|nr:SGNH hydrolase-type esterase domain-containing protein [Zopfochytrium polystomum]
MGSLSLDQIILFGDSITQHSFNVEIGGWGARVAAAYARKLDVFNRGYSGFTSRWCKHILPETLQSTLPPPSAAAAAAASAAPPKIALVTLFLGANDAVLADANPRQHVPLAEYRENLKSMLSDIRRHAPDAKAVLITPPPVDPSRWGPHCVAKGRPNDRSVEQTRAYRDAALEVYGELVAADPTGAERWLRPLDTWPLFLGPETAWSADRCGQVLSDGLHLAFEGNRLLARALLDLVKTAWPRELDPDRLQVRVPTHDVIDVDNLPAAAFVFARTR